VTLSSSYRADIQGLRAVAVLLVLMFHFETPLRGGYLGVDMFFVVSGFVIANSTIREIGRTNQFSWRNFIHRRVRRLLPGMAIVTTTTTLLSLLLLSPFGPQQETSKMLLSAATYSSNFVLMPQNYFSLDPKANPLLHLWSLAVEEQFYLFWPFAIIAILKAKSYLHRKIVSALTWVAILLAISSSLWLFLVCSIHGLQVSNSGWFRPLLERNIAPEQFAFYSPFTRGWEFLAGATLALSPRFKIFSKMMRVPSLFSFVGASLLSIGVYLGSRNPEVQHNMSWSTNTKATIVVVVGTIFLIYGCSTEGFLKRLLSARALTVIGDCSYSIYLVHWPIWVVLITSFKQNEGIVAVAFILSLLLGWAQYQYLEDPIRRKARFPSSGAGHFTITFAFIATSVFMLSTNATPVIARKLVTANQNQFSLHIIEKSCIGGEYELGSAKSCIFSTSASDDKAVLIGDSMAKSLSDAFAIASNAEDLDSYVFSMPGCAFLLFDSPFGLNDECSNWRADVLAAVNELQPKVVVISNLSSLYTDNPLYGKSVPETQALWGSELGRTLIGLSNLNSRIIISQPPPKIDYDLRYDISLLWRNIVKESRDEVLSRRQVINEIESLVVSDSQNQFRLLNFTDEFCNAEYCFPKINGKFMFEDTDHLSVDGSLLVAPVVQNAIALALAG